MTTATKSPIDQAREDLILLDPTDYDSAGAAEEEIVSGIEAETDRDMTEAEYSTIGEMVEDWWNSVDHDDDEEENAE